jgi:hypothetical protein
MTAVTMAMTMCASIKEMKERKKTSVCDGDNACIHKRRKKDNKERERVCVLYRTSL